MLMEDRVGATAVLTLNYPQWRNALALPMREALAAALERIEADREIRAIVVTGAGGVFSAGGDITGMDVANLAQGRDRFRLTHRLVQTMIAGSKPLVAAVEGWAVGAGLALALCCDTIVAATDARFMAGFGRIGLTADFGLIHTLPRRVGEGRARQMLLYNEPVDAARAEQIGLVDHVVAPGDVRRTALDCAAHLTETAPLPMALTKAYLAGDLSRALEWERTTQSALFLSGDHKEGRAAFMEKRSAPSKAPDQQVRSTNDLTVSGANSRRASRPSHPPSRCRSRSSPQAHRKRPGHKTAQRPDSQQNPRYPVPR
jgi:2-(1,2-epoxy-1,2-dihydrophenyl)acetyl-CoA isomerase